MKRGHWIGIIFLVVLVAGVYVTFFYSKSCGDLECFNAYLSKCSSAELQYEGIEATWFYKIEGKKDGKCEVYTELRQLKQGKIDIERLQGQSMKCSLPLGVVDLPEKDISRCHGILKESLQDIIIQKLHSYILSNLGEINEELNKAI